MPFITINDNDKTFTINDPYTKAALNALIPGTFFQTGHSYSIPEFGPIDDYFITIIRKEKIITPRISIRYLNRLRSLMIAAGANMTFSWHGQTYDWGKIRTPSIYRMIKNDINNLQNVENSQSKASFENQNDRKQDNNNFIDLMLDFEYQVNNRTAYVSTSEQQQTVKQYADVNTQGQQQTNVPSPKKDSPSKKIVKQYDKGGPSKLPIFVPPVLEDSPSQRPIFVQPVLEDFPSPQTPTVAGSPSQQTTREASSPQTPTDSYFDYEAFAKDHDGFQKRIEKGKAPDTDRSPKEIKRLKI